MFGILSAIGSLLGGPITAITGQIGAYFTSAKVQEATEFTAMTSAQAAEYTAAMSAATALNQAKVANNASAMGHLMVFLFGLPPAIYLGTLYISAAFPKLGLAVYPLQGDVGKTALNIAETIALSFFIYTPAVAFGGQIFGGLSSWLRGGR